MSYQFLTEDNVVEMYKTSRKYTDKLTDGFLEYERLMRNKPHASIPKMYPKTTDGTTASIIRKTPHRIIQQLPSGTIVSPKNDWISVVAGFIYNEKIIPNANEGYALLQKCWTVTERSLGFGYCGTYAPFVQKNGYFCTDLRLIYWGDISMQPGKMSDDDSNYIFMRSWWQPADIDALIESQKKLSKEARTWDVPNLEEVKTQISTKDDKALTPKEREKQSENVGGVELITGFQRGVGAKFFTFHVTTGRIVRTKVNKDPRGEMPISFAYGDIDGSSPFGRSVIDLVGGLQNLMDGEMQMYQYNRALQLNPPLLKKGNWNKNSAKFQPNAVIDLGSNPDSSLEPLKIDTTALANFPNNYGLMKSQLLNLLASPDTGISAEVGNPGFSKTPQGVEATKANLNIDDNYMRKQFETWFERWSETAINLYFAERTGVEQLQLDEKTADRLRDMPEFAEGGEPQPDGSVSPPGPLAETLSSDNRIRINYNTVTEKLHFRVDPSTSKKQDDAEQVTIIQEALKTVTPQVNYYMGQEGWKFSVGEAYHRLFEKMGVEDISGIITRMSSKEAAEAKKQSFPIIDPPQIRLTGQIPNAAMPAAMAQGGVVVDPSLATTQDQVDLGDIYKDASTPATVKAEIQHIAGLQPDLQGTAAAMAAADAAAQTPVAPVQEQNPVTPDHVLKVHDQTHQQEMDKAKLALEVAKVQQQAEQNAAQNAIAVKAASQRPGAVKKPAGKK